MIPYPTYATNWTGNWRYFFCGCGNNRPSHLLPRQIRFRGAVVGANAPFGRLFFVRLYSLIIDIGTVIHNNGHSCLSRYLPQFVLQPFCKVQHLRAADAAYFSVFKVQHNKKEPVLERKLHFSLGMGLPLNGEYVHYVRTDS